MVQPYPGVREVIRVAFATQALDGDTVDTMLQSLSKNTIQQYNTAYKAWYSFCNENNLNSFDVTVKDLLQFLTIHFKNGAKYGTLNSYRSALSLILGKEKCY